jgi:acyl carrier protein
MEAMQEKVLEILREQDDTVDFEKETGLITNRILDSFEIINLVSDLEDAFDIRIGTAEMIPENFNSLSNIVKMVQRLKG